MLVVDLHEVKAQLSSLPAQVEAGEEVVIARHGRPIAKLVRCGHFGRRKFGALKGRISINECFFEPLSEVELAAWE